jgi:Flp pilus assembly protein CpaB
LESQAIEKPLSKLELLSWEQLRLAEYLGTYEGETLRRFTLRLLLLAGLVYGFAASQALASIPENMAVEQDANKAPQLVTVLLAKKNLPVGTVIKNPEKWFVARKVKFTTANTSVFHEFDEIKNKKLDKAIADGELITQAHICKEDHVPAIPPGQVAFASPIRDVSMTGWWRENTRVDVILVFHGDEEALRARVILRNVLILAVGDEDCACGNSTVSTIITIALFPEEAEQLACDMTHGELTLRVSTKD